MHVCVGIEFKLKEGAKLRAENAKLRNELKCLKLEQENAKLRDDVQRLKLELLAKEGSDSDAPASRPKGRTRAPHHHEIPGE
jgi:hypothetical protein